MQLYALPIQAVCHVLLVATSVTIAIQFIYVPNLSIYLQQSERRPHLAPLPSRSLHIYIAAKSSRSSATTLLCLSVHKWSKDPHYLILSSAMEITERAEI